MGWSTNWPAYEHNDRNIRLLFGEVHDAIVERNNKVGFGPTNFVSEDPMDMGNCRRWGKRWEGVWHWWYKRNFCRLPPYWLARMKMNLGYIIGRFVDHTQADLDGTFNQYFASQPDHTGFPGWTITSILAYCKLPSNFLDWTPLNSGWTGLGPNVSAEVEGRGVGWENSYTRAGGTDFPEGRTKWFTSDYGIDGVKQIVQLLRWRTTEARVNMTSASRGQGYSGYGYPTTWEGAKSHAIDHWGNDPSGAIGHYSGAMGWSSFSGVSLYAYMQMTSCNFWIGPATSGELNIYWLFDVATDYPTNLFTTFGICAEEPTPGKYFLYHTTPDWNGEAWVTPLIGGNYPYNHAWDPYWCPSPVPGITTPQIFKGYDKILMVALVKPEYEYADDPVEE